MKPFQLLLTITALAACNTTTTPPNDTTQQKKDTTSKAPDMTQMPDTSKKAGADTSNLKNSTNTKMGGGKFSGGNASDRKLKNNIIALSTEGSVIPKLLQLDVVSFTYKNEYAGILGLPAGTHYGYIAQNLETQFPNLVQNLHQNANPQGNSSLEKQGFDYKTVNYMQMIPVLTQALKEQQAQIELLKAEIELLKGKRVD